MDGFQVVRGSCRPLYVFEVGLSIDLDAAARRLGAGTRQPGTLQRSPTSQPFTFRPAPLRVIREAGKPVLPPFALGSQVELVLYDFGAATVSYTIPLGASAGELLALSIALRGHEGLLADARTRITELVRALGPAVTRPDVAETVEDYFVFQLQEVAGLAGAGAFCDAHAELLARVLRAEAGELSRDEVADATRARISFGPRDVTLVDWDSAVILDPEPDILRAVLEFANVQLVELRHLDDQLDQALERSYQLLSERGGWRAVIPSGGAEGLRRVSGFQVESALLLERVTNAIKFLGEEYLARVYRLAAGRLHLAEWDASISRKLQAIESIYQKMADRGASRRMELLEWVVIVLIAVELALGLLR